MQCFCIGWYLCHVSPLIHATSANTFFKLFCCSYTLGDWFRPEGRTERERRKEDDEQITSSQIHAYKSLCYASLTLHVILVNNQYWYSWSVLWSDQLGHSNLHLEFVKHVLLLPPKLILNSFLCLVMFCKLTGNLNRKRVVGIETLNWKQIWEMQGMSFGLCYLVKPTFA